MKQTLYIATLTSLFSWTASTTRAQGCVAIRSTGGNLCTMQHPENQSAKDKWQFSIGYRYFNSFRHFVGTVQQKQRLEQHTEVINHVSTLDLSISRNINDRVSIAFGMPVLANSRSQREHFGDQARFQTHSFGIGDARITVYRWMIDPAKGSRGNFQAGLGIKLPTGDYRYQDYFPINDSTRQLRTVDQSIQLGDGGTGIITEINAFYNLNALAGFYGNVYYLFNPREQNGVPTYRSNPNEAIMSVADQYMARVGFNYGFRGGLKNLSAALGGRLEGIPVHDVIGGSEGFRRPGYVVSVEPGLNLSVKSSTFYLEVPVAFVRCRPQSVPDKETTAKTGVHTNGDAAFADYLVNVGYSTRF